MSVRSFLGKTDDGMGTMADGTPRIIIVLECQFEEVADLLVLGAQFAIARTDTESEPVVGEYMRVKVLRSGCPRLTFDLRCDAENAAPVSKDDVPVVLVQIKKGQPVPQRSQMPKGGELAKLAAKWCASKKFRQFLTETFQVAIEDENEKTATEMAADFVRYTCKVASRAELDTNKDAAKVFHNTIRIPYVRYQERV